MYNHSNKFLITYDPQYLEDHTDSSDFDDTKIPEIVHKSGNHCLISKEIAMREISKQEKNVLNHRILNINQIKNGICKEQKFCKEMRCIWESDMAQDSKPMRRKGRNTNNKRDHGNKEIEEIHFNHGDNVETQPKRSLIRHKVIPCLSSMFGRSSNRMATTKLVNNIQRVDGYQIPCTDCEHHRNRKYNKGRTYTVSPVYALQGIHETPLNATKTTQASLYHHKRQIPITQYSNTSCTASLSSEDEFADANKVKEKENKFRKQMKSEMTKQYLKYQTGKYKKHQEQQYPSMQGSYQVFTTPCQRKTRNTNLSPDSGSPYRSNIQSPSSSFWEYLFDKINRKYQTQRLEVPKPCYCSSSPNKYEVKSEPSNCKDQKTIPEENSCSCSGTSNATVSNDSSSKCCPQSKATEGLTLKVPPAAAPTKKGPTSLNKKIQCKCHPEKGKDKSLPSSKPASLPPSRQQNCSGKLCQEPHDEIVQSIANKYNGEILCIHNPPCVLINGCLNLPPAKDAQSVSAWPVLQDRRTSFNRVFRNLSPKSINRVEQGCQYYVPSVEVRQCQTPEYRIEKMIQSICDHNPPCEVVRCCNKYRYDPKLRESCIHVPMCEKIPECMIGMKQQNQVLEPCDHKPKCADVPMCTRDYILLTARDSMGTQVKPQTKMVCRHNPPCIIVPKCLGRSLRDSYISYEAIPDCVHQPPCEMIPACCRKSTKEMVSVSSQYPNGCRVV